MSVMTSQITSNSIVCLAACSVWHRGKRQSAALLALCEGNPPVTHCEGNPPVTSEFPPQRTSNAESGFYSRKVLVDGYCRCLCQCVCVCVYRSLVHSGSVSARITKFGLRTRTPWLRSLLFWGAIDLDLQCQIWLKSKIFWLHHY